MRQGLLALAVFTFFIAADTSQVAIPQVWVDQQKNTFHAPTCKLVTPKMTRRARTVAKAQGIAPAKECAMSDADAKKQWQDELKKGSPITRKGGYSDFGRSVQEPTKTIPSTTGSTDSTSATTPVTPRQPAPPEGPSWNEVMAASNWYNADHKIAELCSREWPADARMQSHCMDRQFEGLSELQQAMPTTPAQRAARVRCAREWPEDYRMRAYCEKKSQ